MLEEQIGTAKSLLAEATKATGIVNARAVVKAGAGMEDINAQGQDWGKATVLVRQAAVELANAKSLAAKMKGAESAKKKGDEAMVPVAIEIALKDLTKEVGTARGDKNKDVAKELFKAMDTGLAEAKRLFDAEDLLGAGTQLKIVGDALVKAMVDMNEHQRFVDTYGPLEQKKKDLTESTEPPAAKITEKTDPLVTALANAKKLGDELKWDKAFETLRQADVLAAEAQRVSDGRKAYDAKHKPIKDAADLLTDPVVKTQTLAIITKADEAADKFDFSHGDRFLDNAQARLDGEGIKTHAKTSPPDIGKIEAAVDKMMKALGGEELLAKPTDSGVKQRNPRPGSEQGAKTPNGPELLDQIVKGFNDDVPAEVIIAIAKKRFDIDMSISALKRYDLGGGKTTYGEEVPTGTAKVNEIGDLKGEVARNKSARNLYETLAMTPEQSDRNPSLKNVVRDKAFNITYKNDNTVDTITRKGGGYYSSDTNSSVMQGRPDTGSTQTFGAAQTAGDGSGPMIAIPPEPWDQETSKSMKAAGIFSPKDLEVYAVANDTPVDFFEFANVHETGHSVDDRLGFMMKRMDSPAFGGWRLHGGDFGAVAGPVADHYAKLAKVPDQASALKQFVIDTMSGSDPEIPTVDLEKQAGVNEACGKVKTEWYPNANAGANPWWSSAKSKTITMDDGRIYQESYGGRWSSYPAAERCKGITGYQFRAPGEWFAELFSAYHHEKLKPGHPARKWLSSLQL